MISEKKFLKRETLDNVEAVLQAIMRDFPADPHQPDLSSTGESG